MMALILSVCFVVDDAIVMLENIVRHIENGKTPLQAALEGSKEIGFTILSMTMSLAAVFIPLLFMSGILGRMLREFAVTICAAILVSGVVSITLTPMLCSRLLRAKHAQARPRLRAAWTASSRRCCGSTNGASACVLQPSRRHGCVVFLGVLGGHRATCTQVSRRGSSRTATTTCCSSTCERRRERRSTRWSTCGCSRSAKLSRRTQHRNLHDQWAAATAERQQPLPGPAQAARGAHRAGAADRRSAAAAASAISRASAPAPNMPPSLQHRRRRIRQPATTTSRCRAPISTISIPRPRNSKQAILTSARSAGRRHDLAIRSPRINIEIDREQAPRSTA